MNRARLVGVLSAQSLRRAARDKQAVTAMLVMPVLIMLIIGISFGGQRDLRIGSVDLAGDAGSADIVADLEAIDRAHHTAYDDPIQAERDVRLGRVDVAVVIRPGDRLTVVRDPASGASANAVALVRAALSGEGGHGRVITDFGGAEPRGTNAFSYTVPSNLVLFTFLTTMVAGVGVIYSRRLGTLRRMLAAPIGPVDLVIGLGGSQFVFAVVQTALLAAVGILFFQVSFGALAGAVALMLVFAAVATGASMFIAARFSHPEQAQALVIPVGIGFGMLGGCMWSLDDVPPVMRAIGHLVPHGWAMDAWIDLVFDHEGLGGILPELGVLSAMALVLISMSARTMRRQLTG